MYICSKNRFEWEWFCADAVLSERNNTSNKSLWKILTSCCKAVDRNCDAWKFILLSVRRSTRQSELTD